MKRILNSLKSHRLGKLLSKFKITRKPKENKTKDPSKFIVFLKSLLFKKIVLVLVIFIALVQVAFGILVYGFKSENKITRIAAKIIPYPIAIVNQDVVTYEDYLSEKDYIHHFYETTQQGNIDYKSIDSEILNQLVENKLIAFQALTNKEKVNKSDIDGAINQIIDQNGGRDQVDKALNELYGLNLNQFRRLVETQMLREKINSDLIIKVSADHILIRVSKDDPQDKVNAAKTKIDNIKKEIDAGLDFNEAAKKYSDDTGSADQGGTIDPFARGEMVQEFSDSAFSLPIGKVSEPVRTEFGFHLIKVKAKTGKIDKSFNDWLKVIKDKSLILNLIQ